MLAKPTWPKYKGAAKDGVEILCKALNLGPNDYRMGKTKVFIRSPNTLFKFEEEREKSFGRMATYVQKIWRGFKARKQWARLKAAIRIQLKWKTYKSRKYHRELYAKFKDVKTMPNYGRDVPYPPHPSVLERFASLSLPPFSCLCALRLNGVQSSCELSVFSFAFLIRKVHLNWRAKMMITSLSKDQQKLMRRKIFTSGIFRGKKAWPVNGPIYGNRLAKDPVHGAKFEPASTKTLNDVGDSSFHFSANCLKVNRKGKSQLRGLAMSQKNIFKLDPQSFKIKKEPVPLTSISGIHLTSKRDHVVVLHLKGGHSLLVEFSPEEGDREVEFAIDVLQLAAAQGNKIEIKFADSIPFQVASRDLTLTVAQDARAKEVTFKASGTGWQGLYPSL